MSKFPISLISIQTGFSATEGQVSQVTGFKLKFSGQLFDIYYTLSISSPHGRAFFI